MTVLSSLGGIVIFIVGVVLVVRFIRWGNQYGNTTPGRPDAAALEAAYAGAGIQMEDGVGTQVARGTLQSVPFVLTLYPFGKPPNGVLEVPGAQGGDFSLAREGDGMREFLRLGSGHSLQTGNEGIPAQIDKLLVAGAERDAARALFQLGFDGLERSGGTLRARKTFCPNLPELEVLGRALEHAAVLRSGIS